MQWSRCERWVNLCTELLVSMKVDSKAAHSPFPVCGRRSMYVLEVVEVTPMLSEVLLDPPPGAVAGE